MGFFGRKVKAYMNKQNYSDYHGGENGKSLNRKRILLYEKLNRKIISGNLVEFKQNKTMVSPSNVRKKFRNNLNAGHY